MLIKHIFRRWNSNKLFINIGQKESFTNTINVWKKIGGGLGSGLINIESSACRMLCFRRLCIFKETISCRMREFIVKVLIQRE